MSGEFERDRFLKYVEIWAQKKLKTTSIFLQAVMYLQFYGSFVFLH